MPPHKGILVLFNYDDNVLLKNLSGFFSVSRSPVYASSNNPIGCVATSPFRAVVFLQSLHRELIMNSIKSSKKFLAGLAFVAAGLSIAGTARADGWPSDVSGSWKIIANQSSSTLVLTQGAAGGGAQCLPINGTVFGDTVQGFYCPGSGRIAFRRVNAVQTYVGNLSQTGTTNRMAGTWESLGGSFGEYAFYATK
jgi:hypothetical protein